jgi:hypothetical protein
MVFPLLRGLRRCTLAEPRPIGVPLHTKPVTRAASSPGGSAASVRRLPTRALQAAGGRPVLRRRRCSDGSDPLDGVDATIRQGPREGEHQPWIPSGTGLHGGRDLLVADTTRHNQGCVLMRDDQAVDRAQHTHLRPRGAFVAQPSGRRRQKSKQGATLPHSLTMASLSARPGRWQT